MCANGKFIAWELKATAQAEATPLQKYYLDHINKSGGYAVVVHPGNFDEEFAYLESICNA